MAAAPLRYQVLAVIGIFAFTALLGGMVYGTRALLDDFWVQPTCEDACNHQHSKLKEIYYESGKHSSHSACICANGESLPSSPANTTQDLSAIIPIATVMSSFALIVWRLSKRFDKDPN